MRKYDTYGGSRDRFQPNCKPGTVFFRKRFCNCITTSWQLTHARCRIIHTLPPHELIQRQTPQRLRRPSTVQLAALNVPVAIPPIHKLSFTRTIIPTAARLLVEDIVLFVRTLEHRDAATLGRRTICEVRRIGFESHQLAAVLLFITLVQPLAVAAILLATQSRFRVVNQAQRTVFRNWFFVHTRAVMIASAIVRIGEGTGARTEERSGRVAVRIGRVRCAGATAIIAVRCGRLADCGWNGWLIGSYTCDNGGAVCGALYPGWWTLERCRII